MVRETDFPTTSAGSCGCAAIGELVPRVRVLDERAAMIAISTITSNSGNRHQAPGGRLPAAGVVRGSSRDDSVMALPTYHLPRAGQAPRLIDVVLG
jgi:hypothetical protein